MASLLTSVLLLAGSDTFPVSYPLAVAFTPDGSKVLAVSYDFRNLTKYAHVGTPTGSEISWATKQVIQSSQDVAAQGGAALGYDEVSGNFVLVCRQNNDVEGAVISINPSTDIITVGSWVTLSTQSKYPEGVQSLGSGNLVTYFGDGQAHAVTMSVSGTTLTKINEYSSAADGFYQDSKYAYDPATKTIVHMTATTNNFDQEYHVGTISGTAVTWASTVRTPDRETGKVTFGYDPVLDRFWYHNGIEAYYGELSGSTITWGSAQTNSVGINMFVNTQTHKFSSVSGKSLWVAGGLENNQHQVYLNEMTNSLTGLSFRDDNIVLLPSDGTQSDRIRPQDIAFAPDGTFVIIYSSSYDDDVQAISGNVNDEWPLGCAQEFDLGLNLPTVFNTPDKDLIFHFGFDNGKVVQIYDPDTSVGPTRVFAGQSNLITGVITQLSDAAISADEYVINDAKKFSSTQIVIIYTKPNESSVGKFSRIGTFNGTSVSWGSETTLVASGNGGTGHIAYDSVSGKFIALWYNTNTGNEYYQLGTISGGSISWETAQVFDTSRFTSFSVRDLVFFNGQIWYFKSTNLILGTVTGAATVSWGTPVAVHTLFDQFESSTSFTNPHFVVDTSRGYLYAAFNTGNNNSWLARLSNSGTVPSGEGANRTQTNHDDSSVGSISVGYQPFSDVFVALQGHSSSGEYFLTLGIPDGSGGVDFCVSFPQLLSDHYSSTKTAYSSMAIDASTGLSWVTFGDGTDSRLHTIMLPVEINYLCDTKPRVIVVQSEPTPGAPGHPGQAYVPAYCVPGYCVDITSELVVTPEGTFEYRCISEPTEESLVLGFPEYETVCAFYPVIVPQTVDPYAPNYDPTYDPNDPPAPGAPGFGVKTTCNPPTCYREVPYFPPTPAQDASAAEYYVDYDFGWNYDVLLASGQNITLSIDNTMVRTDTAGIAIGFANIEDWPRAGIGKFPAFLLFEADRVGILEGGLYVWGPTTREVSDVFKIAQFGTQLSFLKNDIEIYKDDVLAGGSVAAGGIIYKAGNTICKPDPDGPNPVSESVAASGSGSADITLPAFLVVASEDPYGLGEVIVPAPTLDASTGNHGSSDITLPALFVNSSEGYGGYALIDLPAVQVAGYAGAALSGYANNLALPSPEVFAADGDGYSEGAVTLPAMTASGSGDFAIPVAQGLEAAVPFFLASMTGFTGSVGGADVSLPPIDAVGADREVYGELDQEIPAPKAFGGEYPDYDGILNGNFQRLEMSQGFGTMLAPNTLEGDIEGLEGGLLGGAYLDQSFAALDGNLSGDLAVVGRLDGYFLAMTMNSTGITGMYGELTGTLGERLTGELYGGALFDGSMAALSGDLSGTSGAVAILDGAFAALTGDLAGNLEAFGTLDGDLPTLESLWGVLSGDLPGLTGEYVQASLSVSEYVAWVVNLKNNAITRYPAWQFDFLVRFRDENYFVRSDGIYRVDTGFDIDQPIDAGFTLPENDMGVETMKISPRLYLQGSIDGQFSVQTTADSQNPVISLSQIAPGVGYKRCKLPRGIKGTHLEFAVDNIAGADFEIEQVDALVADTGRKI